MFSRGLKLLIIGSLLSITHATKSALAEDIAVNNQAQIIAQIYQLVDNRNLNSPIFTQALNSNQPTLMIHALTGIARVGGKLAIEKARPYLNHTNPKIRQHAALALGLSANKEAAHYLWKQLETETSDLVKHEIYLGLGNLGQNNLVTKMLEQLEKEQSPTAQASLFHGLGTALVFNSSLKDNFEDIDFEKLLKRFTKGDENAARVGFFIDRIPNVGKLIEAENILPLTRRKLSSIATVYLTRLISKISQHDGTHNRELLAWLIEQSNKASLSEQIEAIRGMKNMMKFPQSLVQLGKLQASSNPIVAQTALNVLATSDNNSFNLISLLKGKLKSDKETLVVEAMRGLIKRQPKDKMSWVLKLLKHPSSYVKIQLMALLKQKESENFTNVFKLMAQDPSPSVSHYAKTLIGKTTPPKESIATSPEYSVIKQAVGKYAILKTSIGDITIKMLGNAPYTAWHFINNAQNGVFNNNYFSRVIGNFVAQGGDTIGDGTGSSDKTIREEISLLNHEPFTVAMATAGKDTGTSQFFINTARNLHLDRNYSVFAKVVKGQENVLALTNGAIIYAIEVK